jgi:hypothetical protein
MLQSRISVPLEWTALVTAMSRIASVKWGSICCGEGKRIFNQL